MGMMYYDHWKLSEPQESSLKEQPEPLEYGVTAELLCDICGEWKPESEVNGIAGGTFERPEPRCYLCMKAVAGDREIMSHGV